MKITGVTYSYYFYCKKRMWLFYNNINMEHMSEIVKDGKINHENSKNRRNKKYKEIEFDLIKIDFYDKENNVIYETKRNFKHKNTDINQLKYYLYIFYKSGNHGVKGILEYPKNRKKYNIEINDLEIFEIEKNLCNIEKILNTNCPNQKICSKCKNCSYLEFCQT